MSALAAFEREFERSKVRADCLCGSAKGVPILRRDRYGLRIEPSFCLDCGHVYARFRLDEAALRRFYATAYRDLYTGGRGLKTPESRDSRVRASRKNILPAFQATFPDWRARRVLEWGCGAGWNLVCFKEEGVGARGYDYDREYADYGRAEFGLDLRVLEPEREAELPPEKADFLILNHVLEHVPEPFALLERLRALLGPEGRVYAGLPFLENIPTWGFVPFFHIAHLHYFSLPHFAAMAERRGFAAERACVEKGWVVLRPGTPRPGALPRRRAHNAGQLAKYALRYQVLGRLWRALVEPVKRVPWLERPLRKLKSRVLGENP